MPSAAHLSQNDAAKYQNVRTDFQDGVGEVAGVLWRVANYAWERFRFHDLVVRTAVQRQQQRSALQAGGVGGRRRTGGRRRW